MNTIEKKIFFILLSFSLLIVTFIQLLYTLGSVAHLLVLIYKFGSFASDFISFGWKGIIFYFTFSIVILTTSIFIIKSSFKVSEWWIWKLILYLSVFHNVVLLVLIFFPCSRIVSR